jgi:hypothetical protein
LIDALQIFGPVVVAEAFDDIDDVVRRANATSYGLAAGLWTRDLSKAHRVSAQLRAGTVWINVRSSFPLLVYYPPSPSLSLPLPPSPSLSLPLPPSLSLPHAPCSCSCSRSCFSVPVPVGARTLHLSPAVVIAAMH